MLLLSSWVLFTKRITCKPVTRATFTVRHKMVLARTNENYQTLTKVVLHGS